MKKKFYIIIHLLSLSLFYCNYDFTIGSWEDGVIPYYLSGEFTSEDLTTLFIAMESWETVCGVKFEKVSPRSNAYQIIHDYQIGWYSTIGENNSNCYMHFSGQVPDLIAVTHELGHCLGLVHEHQRPDRDLYISIAWDKVIHGKEFNFEIMDNPLIVEQEFEYDYNSIMHYPPVSFSMDGSETIITNDGSEISPDGISAIDIQKVRAIYGLPIDEDE